MKDVIDLISQGKDWIEYSRLRYLGKHLMQIKEGAKSDSPLVSRPKVNMKSSNSASVGSTDHEIEEDNDNELLKGNNQRKMIKYNCIAEIVSKLI